MSPIDGFGFVPASAGIVRFKDDEFEIRIVTDGSAANEARCACGGSCACVGFARSVAGCACAGCACVGSGGLGGELCKGTRLAAAGGDAGVAL